MRVILPAVAAASLVVASATAAAADPLLASNPTTFSNFFFDQGLPAQLTTDPAGDPFIEFRFEDATYPLFFYDCVDNADCLSVQFYTGFEMDAPVALERLNEWNSGERRFLRAYLTPENNVVHLEMDVATSSDGISARDFNDLLLLWVDRAREFEAFIAE